MTPNEEKKENENLGTTVGVLIGALVLVLIAIFVIRWLNNKKTVRKYLPEPVTWKYGNETKLFPKATERTEMYRWIQKYFEKLPEVKRLTKPN